jgi:nicotinate phosphoribosyltransferase
MAEMLGEAFVGTSNAYLAFQHGYDVKGTNAHELPMVLAALAKDDAELRDAPHRVLREWQETYPERLLVGLPDTYGSTRFLAEAPREVAHFWKGFRPDSKPAVEAGEELIDWWRGHGVDPRERFVLFSDGLDVAIDGFAPNGVDIAALHAAFHGRVGLAYGWGTNATNDFRGCDPRGEDLFDPLSLVCKVVRAGGRPAVKLSDNFEKASGPPAEVERYRRVFGSAGMSGVPVRV